MGNKKLSCVRMVKRILNEYAAEVNAAETLGDVDKAWKKLINKLSEVLDEVILTESTLDYAVAPRYVISYRTWLIGKIQSHQIYAEVIDEKVDDKRMLSIGYVWII